MLKRGDFVAKLGGDYIFKGRVVAVFDKLGGEGVQRVVVQNGDGVLMIMNPGQLHQYSDKVQEEVRDQTRLGELIAPLVKTIEDEYRYRGRIGVSNNKAFAVTGEEYVEITSLIDFDALQDVEGKRHSANFKLYDTPQEAIDAALTNFNLYANWCASRNSSDCGLRLYWRMKPEIDQHEGKWKVYMRCLLSAKPPLDAQSLSLLLSKKSSSSTLVSFR